MELDWIYNEDVLGALRCARSWVDFEGQPQTVTLKKNPVTGETGVVEGGLTPELSGSYCVEVCIKPGLTDADLMVKLDLCKCVLVF